MQAFFCCGGLSLLCHRVPACPLPVPRRLFQVSRRRRTGGPASRGVTPVTPSFFRQLMTLCPDTTNASQALWEIWQSAAGEWWGPPRHGDPRTVPTLTGPSPADEPWCPMVQGIGQAFARLSADLSPLRRWHLLPPKLCPADGR